MARQARTSRSRTEADLNERQRRIYAALSDELREAYLQEIGPVPVSLASGRRKAEQVRARLQRVDVIIARFQQHRRHLVDLAKQLEQGTVNAIDVDLRRELAAPEIAGVSVRYERGPKESPGSKA